MKQTFRLISTILLALILGGSSLGYSAALAQSGVSISYYLPLISRTYPQQISIDTRAQAAEAGFELALAAGSGWVRIDLNWSDIQRAQVAEGANPLYDWSAAAGVENQLAIAAANAQQIVLVIGSTPEWAAENSDCVVKGRVRPANYPDLQRFAAAVVARYSIPPYGVRYFELWNEPDVSTWLGCWGNPDEDYFGGVQYGEMLAAVYPAMKAANPGAQVLVGGLLMDQNPDVSGLPRNQATQTHFFEGILISAGKNSYDGVSFHAYDYYAPQGGGVYFQNANWGTSNAVIGSSQIAKAAYLRRELARADVTGKYLLNTEVGLLCKDCANPVTDPARYEGFERAKAYYAAEALAAAVYEGFVGVMWFTMIERNDGPLYSNSGLVKSDLTPLPGYYAFQYASGQLYGATPLHKAASEYAQALDGYVFRNPDGNTLRVIWATGAPFNLDLGFDPTSVTRISASDGKPEPLTPGQVITVTEAPLFILQH